MRSAAAVVVAVALLFSGVAAAYTETKQEPTDRYIVDTWTVKPKKKIKTKRKFKPTATPSVSEVKWIAAHEQKRWGGPSVLGRIYCESRYQWNATNGQYRGLLQIGSIWGYLWDGTPRTITIKKVKRVRKPVWRYRAWSDGSQGRIRLRYKRVKKITIKKGKLPKSADPYHGWAAIRVGQRALAGYKTTGWACGI
jgi:hypothetical protein